MKNINIFCFGFGQIAKNFIKKIQLENIKINLSTTSTKDTCIKDINDLKYESFFLTVILLIKILLKNLMKLIIF